MRERETGGTRIYKSSLASMLWEFILAVFFSLLLACIMIILDNGEDVPTTLVAVTAGGSLLGLFVIVSRYTEVIVSDNEVTVKHIGVKTPLARDTHEFGSLTKVGTYNQLRFYTNRTLLATGESGDIRLTLHNFSARDFALLMADIRRPPATAGKNADKECFTAEFITPKEEILKAHRRMMRTTLSIFLAIGVLVALLTGSPLGAAIGCGLVYFCVRLVIGSEYGKVKRRMPTRVSIGNERICFDEDEYQPAEGLTITATPPSFPKNSTLSHRTMKVRGAWGEKGKYHFSLCPNNNNGKYVYHGYEEMCDALEHASHIHNFIMTYDL